MAKIMDTGLWSSDSCGDFFVMVIHHGGVDMITIRLRKDKCFLFFHVIFPTDPGITGTLFFKGLFQLPLPQKLHHIRGTDNFSGFVILKRGESIASVSFYTTLQLFAYFYCVGFKIDTIPGKTDRFRFPCSGKKNELKGSLIIVAS